MIIQQREPGVKWIDRTGEVTQYGMKILSFAGFGQQQDGKKTSFSVWNVECPHCHSVTPMWGTGLKRNKSCGCVNFRQKDAIYHSMRAIWNRLNAAHHFGTEWSDFSQFEKDLRTEWEKLDSPKVIAVDRQQPIGPRNYKLLPQQAGVTVRAYGLRFFVDGQWYTTGTAREMLGVSRQRIHQMSEDSVVSRIREVLRNQSAPAHQNPAINGV